MDIFGNFKVIKSSAFTVQPCEIVSAVGFFINEQECSYEENCDCESGIFECVVDCGLPDGIGFQLQFRVDGECSGDSCWIPYRRNGEEIILNNLNNPVFIDGDVMPGTYCFVPLIPLNGITAGIKIERSRKCR